MPSSHVPYTYLALQLYFILPCVYPVTFILHIYNLMHKKVQPAELTDIWTFTNPPEIHSSYYPYNYPPKIHLVPHALATTWHKPSQLCFPCTLVALWLFHPLKMPFKYAPYPLITLQRYFLYYTPVMHLLFMYTLFTLLMLNPLLFHILSLPSHTVTSIILVNFKPLTLTICFYTSLP